MISKRVIRNFSEKLLQDLPQRVIVHKILTFHEITIRDFEEDPYLLFGYFKFDRLRNIWFVFSSVKCVGSYFRSVNVLNSVIVDYSKLFSIFFDRHKTPTILSELSSKMYSIRSFGFCSGSSALFVHATESLNEDFFAKTKFPKLKRFSLKLNSVNDIISKNWIDMIECDFFNKLESLEFSIPNVSEFDFVRFFKSKEKVFGGNLKKISLSHIILEKKVIVFLPNLEKFNILNCRNLYIIPSKEKLKEIDFCCLYEDLEEFELKKIAKNSINARSIRIVFGSSSNCEIFFRLFEEEDFPNLEKLTIFSAREDFTIRKNFKFCFRLKELSIFHNFRKNRDFFQKNEWDQLEKLVIHGDGLSQMKDVNFPSLQFLQYEGGVTREAGVVLTDEFFCFECRVLEELVIRFSGSYLKGNGWNENIFRSLKVLKFNNEFDDLIFQENEFPNLRKIVMKSGKCITDRSSWKEMKNLEEIEVKGENYYISSWKK